jgi:hypothetical protein
MRSSAREMTPREPGGFDERADAGASANFLIGVGAVACCRRSAVGASRSRATPAAGLREPL